MCLATMNDRVTDSWIPTIDYCPPGTVGEHGFIFVLLSTVVGMKVAAAFSVPMSCEVVVEAADDGVQPMTFATICPNRVFLTKEIVHLHWYGLIANTKKLHTKGHFEIQWANLS